MSSTIHELVPLLFVQNIDHSAAFYRDQLGFTLTQTWELDGNLGWCRLERGRAAVMLQQACEEDGPPEGRGRGVGFFFNSDDVDSLYAEFSGSGLAIKPPSVAFYGMKQIFVHDPDGYELCFQSVVDAAALRN